MDGRPILQRYEGSDPGSSPIPFEDAELIERVKNGHAESYGLLVRKYQDRVFNTCWRICGHLDDARDLTQEAFLKAFDSLAAFRGQSGFYTWVFRVAVNLALSHRRTTQRRRVVSFDQLSGTAPTQADTLIERASTEDPALVAGEAELHGCVARALQDLDDDHRAVVVLRDIEGFDYAQIAEILSIPSGTVKSRLHRARLALRDAIQPALGRD